MDCTAYIPDLASSVSKLQAIYWWKTLPINEEIRKSTEILEISRPENHYSDNFGWLMVLEYHWNKCVDAEENNNNSNYNNIRIIINK